MRLIVSLAILLAISVANISAQFAPSRPQLNVPGAVPLGAVRQRGERIASGPAQGLIRVRRPLQKQVVHQEPQTSQARFFEEHEDKPVNEDLEDEPFIPHIQQSSPPSPPQPPKSLFTSEPQDNLNDIGFSQQTRFGNQPIAAPQQQTPSNAQRFNIERPKPAVAAPQLRQLQQRPVSRPAPSFDDYDERPSRPATRINNEQQRPQQKPRDRESKPKRPVATIISKYRDTAEDGTISWGYEDSDGGFKDEVIGVDCVTRGRYGYVDETDGQKREYTYETGILCDPNKRDEEEEEELEAEQPYINYEQNQAILANGQRIDLSNMGKNKSKRPQQYRN